MDFCRACMTSEQSNRMIFLFRNNRNLIYSECTSLEINETDNLPAYICNNCNQQLDNFSQFRRTCLTSDSTFKQKIKIEKADVIDSEEFYERPILAFEQYIGAGDDTIIKDTLQLSSNSPADDYIKAELKRSNSDNDESDGDRNALCSDSSYADDALRPKKKTKKKNTLQKTLSCDMCDKKFLAKHILIGHLRQHVGLKPYTCRTCHKHYNQYNSLLKHQRLEHKNTHLLQYNCGFDGCDKAYKFKSALKKHFSTDHGSPSAAAKEAAKKIRLKKFVCELCNKRTHEKYQMEAHMRLVHEGKQKAYLCNVCGKEYLSYRTLSVHTHIKHNKNFEKHKCDFEGCDKGFSFRESLITHKRVVHLGIVKPKPKPVLERDFVCEQCGKAFKRAQELKYHNFTHTGEKPFGCHICPKRYSIKFNLTDHIRRHLNIKNHECPICGAKKTSASELKVHINYHTNENTYPCTMCPMIFKQQGARSRHTRVVHLGIKAYKCTYCQRAFSKKESMRNHVMIHTGEKPHACPICGTRFRQIIAMKTHLKVHNKIKV